MVYNRAEIICSYLKMNNKDDEFKIIFTGDGFYITQNNNRIFYFVYLYINSAYMCFYKNTLMIYKKRLKNKYQIDNIDTKKIEKDYYLKCKKIYYYTIDSTKGSYIKYNFDKDYIIFLGYIKVISYKINIKYINRLIYKFHDLYICSINHFKYTNYKILLPNKYELLYYSKYFLMYL